MPTDARGRPHTGNFGLFDEASDCQDDDVAHHDERYERKRLDGIIIPRKSYETWQLHDDTRPASHATRSRRRLPWVAICWKRVFGRPKVQSSGVVSSQPFIEERTWTEKARGEYVMSRRPMPSRTVYTRRDIDAVDSPWLRECGMVKVHSSDPGGCHIVPKSIIGKA